MLSPRRLSQLASIPVVLGSGLTLGIARWLTASAEGHGTHRQLGLNPCSFLTLTGQPCPMCGMTTCFTHLAHGHVLAALVTQPFGLVLFGLTAGAFAIGLAELVQPRDRWTRLFDLIQPVERKVVVLFLLGLLLGWIYKIAVMW